MSYSFFASLMAGYGVKEVAASSSAAVVEEGMRSHPARVTGREKVAYDFDLPRL